MLDFVRVFFRVRVHALHAGAFGGAGDTGLGGVDVVVEAVEETDYDHGWDALEEDEEVVFFVDFAGAEGVVVQGAHGPADGAAFFAEARVEFGLPDCDQLLVCELLVCC